MSHSSILIEVFHESVPEAFQQIELQAENGFVAGALSPQLYEKIVDAVFNQLLVVRNPFSVVIKVGDVFFIERSECEFASVPELIPDLFRVRVTGHSTRRGDRRATVGQFHFHTV